MSSSPTGRTSTTGSSTSSPSRPDARTTEIGSVDQQNGPGDARDGDGVVPALPVVPGLEARSAAGEEWAHRGRVALIACGAIAQPCKEIAARRNLSVDVHPLPPLLHNRPERIADEVARLASELAGRYEDVVVGYADCGTYGALDEVCNRLGLRRLAGLHCYDVFGGEDRVAAMFEAEPGTYVLTDFLVRSFARTVVTELGLDRYPELRDSYFGHYTRVVWLAQQPDDELELLAQDAAARIGLPLVRVDVGVSGLEEQLVALTT